MDIKTKLARAGKDAAKSAVYHHLLPARYRKRIKDTPILPKKAVFLEEYAETLSDNLQTVADALRERGGYQIEEVYLKNGTGTYADLTANMQKAVDQIADARAVFLSESSGLISCLPVREGTTVIQLWHACGAFKKFGYSLKDKRYGSSTEELDRFPMHRNFDYVTVSSPEVIWAYAEAFHMEDRKEKIVPVGIARTDRFFKEEQIRSARDKLRAAAPKLFEKKGRKTILYAPTFRGNQKEARAPEDLDLELLSRLLDSRYNLVIKQHPFVKMRLPVPEAFSGFACDVTDTMQIEDLLMACDVCISDYSSVVFEYALLERPILFFAGDLEEYEDWRGFYYPYEEMTPGPVLRTSAEAARELIELEKGFDSSRIRTFKERFMSGCDGHATERILKLAGLDAERDGTKN